MCWAECVEVSMWVCLYTCWFSPHPCVPELGLQPGHRWWLAGRLRRWLARVRRWRPRRKDSRLAPTFAAALLAGCPCIKWYCKIKVRFWYDGFICCERKHVCIWCIAESIYEETHWPPSPPPPTPTPPHPRNWWAGPCYSRPPPPPLPPRQLTVGMQNIHSIRVVFLAMGMEFCFSRFLVMDMAVWLWLWAV